MKALLNLPDTHKRPADFFSNKPAVSVAILKSKNYIQIVLYLMISQVWVVAGSVFAIENS